MLGRDGLARIAGSAVEVENELVQTGRAPRQARTSIPDLPAKPPPAKAAQPFHPPIPIGLPFAVAVHEAEVGIGIRAEGGIELRRGVSGREIKDLGGAPRKTFAGRFGRGGRHCYVFRWKVITPNRPTALKARLAMAGLVSVGRAVIRAPELTAPQMPKLTETQTIILSAGV